MALAAQPARTDRAAVEPGDDAADAQPALRPRGLPPAGTAPALATFELLLLRGSAGPVSLLDAAAALLLAALLTALCVGAERGPRRLAVLVAGLPLAVYACGLLVPVILDLPKFEPALAGVLLLVAFAAFRPALRARSRPATVRSQLTWLTAFAGLAGMASLGALRLPDGGVPWLALGGVVACLAAGRFAPLILPLALVPSFAAPETWSGRGAASAAIASAPDVLLISVDTLRADAARGMQTHARLAAAGAAFDGQSAAPWTLPALASLMTGLEVQQHGAARDAGGMLYAVRSDVPLLAERLRDAGYDTAASVENPFAGQSFGFARGFARFRHNDYTPLALPKVALSSRCRALGPALLAAAGLLPELPQGVHQHVDDVRDFLAARRERPLFVWVHVLEPHTPYRHALELPVGWRQRIELARLVRSATDVTPGRRDVARYRRAYAHQVEVADRALLELLDLFRERPVVVIFAADHGEEFLEHGAWEHGHTQYQELLSVPLAIAGIPGLEPQVAGLVDVVPTLLAFLDLDASGLDGRDLARTLPAPLRSSSTLYAGSEPRAVRLGSRKLLADSAGLREFDLEADPGERSPLPASPELAAALPPPWTPAVSSPAPPDPATRRQLESLGYVD